MTAEIIRLNRFLNYADLIKPAELIEDYKSAIADLEMCIIIGKDKDGAMHYFKAGGNTADFIAIVEEYKVMEIIKKYE